MRNTRLIGYELTIGYCRDRHRNGGEEIFAKDNFKDNVEIFNIYDFSVDPVCQIAAVKVKNAAAENIS